MHLLVLSLLLDLWVRGLCQDDAAVYIVTMKQAPVVHHNVDVKRFGSSEISDGAAGTMNTLNKPKRYVASQSSSCLSLPFWMLYHLSGIRACLNPIELISNGLYYFSVKL